MFGFIKQFAPLVLYICFIIACLLSVSGKVKWGLLFLIPLLPLQNIVEKIHQLPLGQDFNDILLFCMIIGWVFSKMSNSQRLLRPSGYNVIIPIYFVYTYITLWIGSVYLSAPAPVSP
ncbi:MAG: hypothetical protein KC713_10575, partial [Candidatus Omnitrophica bacterium]|nr:hypothetical protein [Candidatus Omnitrophota bacterium]